MIQFLWIFTQGLDTREQNWSCEALQVEAFMFFYIMGLVRCIGDYASNCFMSIWIAWGATTYFCAHVWSFHYIDWKEQKTTVYCKLQAHLGVDKKMSFHSDNGMLFPHIFLSRNTFFTNEKEKHLGIRKLWKKVWL